MTLHHQLHGSADDPPIVFLHGLGTSSWIWEDQVRALAPHRPCLTIDLPGCGRSGDLAWTSMADTAAQVADLIATVTSAAGPPTRRPAHVVGLSLGGYVTLRLLADHPDTVATAIVSGVTTAPLEPRWLWRAATNTLSPLLTTRPVATLAGRAMQLPDEARAAYVADTTALRPGTIRRIYDEIVHFRLPGELAERDHPVLAVAGAREAGAVRAGLAAVPALLPNGAAAIAPGVHHGWNGEDPVLFTAMVASWTDDHALPAGLDALVAPARSAA